MNEKIINANDPLLFKKVNVVISCYFLVMFLFVVFKNFDYFTTLNFTKMICFLVSFIVLFPIFSLVHELSHKLVAKAFKVEGKIKLKFSLNNPAVIIFDGQRFGKLGFILTAIAPIFVLNLMLFLVMFSGLPMDLRFPLEIVLVFKALWFSGDLTLVIKCLQLVNHKDSILALEVNKFKIERWNLNEYQNEQRGI